MKILVLDNYDSFTYNLVHMLKELKEDADIDVYRNDQIGLEEVSRYHKILLSPGPGLPADAGIMPELIQHYGPKKHILGICLGHQAIAECFGAQLYNLPEVKHGIQTPTQLTAEEDLLFSGLPNKFDTARYHSWAIDPQSVGEKLQVLAEDDAGGVMAIRHKEYPVYGLQFHPESVITDHGAQILENWLNLPIKKENKTKGPKASNMKSILNYLFAHNRLSRPEAADILRQIAQGDRYNQAQVVAFLTVFIMRGISVDELAGFRDAMLELCIPVDLKDFDPIDLCGTGGDGKDTFNISTLASFVTAGAGVHVAKHGNYGVSSVSGSSNIIEHFGGRFSNDTDQLKRQIDQSGICFLHAPQFHPAMKNVGPIRRELGVKTFFNMLGPMVNPAFPQKQIVGVFSQELARLYGYLYQKTDKQFVILHSMDGYDEISLTGQTRCLSNDGECMLSPEDLGMKQWSADDLYGGKTVQEAANIFEKVLKNEGTPAQEQVVLANAAMAIQCARPSLSRQAAIEMATDALHTGKARKSFETFISLAQ